ncbi:MAG: hypothetical protein ACPGQL_07680 [Thermoplasmatota archaeon]
MADHESERGRLLFEYRPPRAHPILYAGLLVFSFVFLTGSLENALRDDRGSLYLVYAAPLVGTGLLILLGLPSPTRIHAGGIAPSRPLLLRWRRPFAHWDDLAAIYPSYYDVTGAFVSPFASSDGKVTQMGLGLERPGGRTETVRFTPTRFTMWQAESAGYKEAMGVLRQVFADLGRPLTPEADPIPVPRRREMLDEANAPFLPFIVIVLLVASAAPVLWVLTRLAVPIGPALLLAAIAPLGVMLRSAVQSRRRNALLNRLAKLAEYERHTVGGGAA